MLLLVKDIALSITLRVNLPMLLLLTLHLLPLHLLSLDRLEGHCRFIVRVLGRTMQELCLVLYIIKRLDRLID